MSNNMLHHETIYRGSDALNKMKSTKLIICGAGAIGSNLVDNLTRQGFANIRVIDFDRVEKHNINTQAYSLNDVGMLKVQALQSKVYLNTEISIEVDYKKIEQKNVKKLLKGADIVVDALDNTEGRQLLTDYCKDNKLPCLHIGTIDEYCEVVWNEKYVVPAANAADVDPCDLANSRNLNTFAVSIAAEILIGFIDKKERRSLSFTLKDMKVSQY